MNDIQRQSILIVLQGLEQQVQMLKNLINLTPSNQQQKLAKQPTFSSAYTSDEDDKLIAEALEIDEDDHKDKFIEELMAEVAQDSDPVIDG